MHGPVGITGFTGNATNVYLCRDNEHLRRELVLLKDKHLRQQRVLNKVSTMVVTICPIRFASWRLRNMIYTSRRGV